MMPMLAFHGAISAISSRLSVPQFVCGSRPVSSSTSLLTAATYSGVDSKPRSRSVSRISG